MRRLKEPGRMRLSGLSTICIIRGQGIFSTYSIERRKFLESCLSTVSERNGQMQVSFPNGKSLGIKGYVVYSAYRREILLMGVSAIVGYPRLQWLRTR